MLAIVRRIASGHNEAHIFAEDELQRIPMKTDDDFNQELRELLRDGQKIEAIRRYRERTGTGLKEAKDAVEHLEHGGLLPPENTAKQAAILPDLVSLLEQGRKIEAIKLYREKLGGGLKEAKQDVERIAREHGIQPSKAGCFGVLLLCITAAALWWSRV